MSEHWRIGRHYGIHVYEVGPDTPDGDRPVATFHREEDAWRCVEAVNADGSETIAHSHRGGTDAMRGPNRRGQVHDRGVCPVCGRTVATRNGKIMYHYQHPRGPLNPHGVSCPGKNQAAP